MAKKVLIHEALQKAKIHEDLMFTATIESKVAGAIDYTLIIMNYSRQEIHYNLSNPYMSVDEFFKFVQEYDIHNAKEELHQLKQQLKKLPAQIKAQEKVVKSLKVKKDIKAILQKFAAPY
jgi:hypothetical protein